MMECITVSDVINVSVEEVWKKISAFDEFSDYHPGAVRSFIFIRLLINKVVFGELKCLMDTSKSY